MPLSIKDSLDYKLVLGVWTKVADTWIELACIFIKSLGLWKIVHLPQGSFRFVQVLSGTVYNYSIREAAIAAGWDTIAPLSADITIAAGTTVASLISGGYAFSTGGSYPSGSSLTLTNYGVIRGKAGIGGAGGNASTSPTNGTSGGPALLALHALRLYNYGVIAGGGGGGAGGRCWRIISYPAYWGRNQVSVNIQAGGGGGGGGALQGAGGAGGGTSYSPSARVTLTNGGSGGAGGMYTAGAGGAGGTGIVYPAGSPAVRGESGGAGGVNGSSGSLAPLNGAGYSYLGTSALAGLGGAAISGTLFITYESLGSIYGGSI